MNKTRLESLISRLEKVRCYGDETSFGIRTTRWMHLVPYDIDVALDYLKQLRESL